MKLAAIFDYAVDQTPGLENYWGGGFPWPLLRKHCEVLFDEVGAGVLFVYIEWAFSVYTVHCSTAKLPLQDFKSVPR